MFTLTGSYKQARTGILNTAHGTVHTPVFMPVGTKATVKAMLPDQVAATGAQIILGNTYHLMLNPGAERIARLGGLHQFMKWSGPILTDSGGFQVMSLSSFCKVNEDGAQFTSYKDGSKHFLTPELSTHIQYLLGSDITMAFDECTSFPITYEKAKESMELSMRFAQRSRKSFIPRTGYGQFGIVQGSIYKDLRLQSIQALTAIGFEGYAVGGITTSLEALLGVLDYTLPALPWQQPRYIMGVGKPLDIIESVKRGADMFDCVIPTRSGRNGQAFTSRGVMNLRNAKYKEDLAPLSLECNCLACTNFSRAYLYHLVHEKEILASVLLTNHNLYYFQDLMARLRKCIIDQQEINFVA